MMETLPEAGRELLVEVVVEKDLLLLQLDRLLRDRTGTGHPVWSMSRISGHVWITALDTSVSPNRMFLELTLALAMDRR